MVLVPHKSVIGPPCQTCLRCVSDQKIQLFETPRKLKFLIGDTWETGLAQGSDDRFLGRQHHELYRRRPQIDFQSMGIGESVTWGGVNYGI